jgi:6-phosphogluconolactonase
MRKRIRTSRSAIRILTKNHAGIFAAFCAFLIVALSASIAPRPLRVTQAQASTEMNGNYLVYVGTYTSKGSAPTGSKGIYAYRFNAASGEIESLGLAAESEQPSFLAVDPQRKFLYAVNETDTYEGQPSGGVSAFSLDHTTGKLTFLNEVASRGGSPAHVAVDHTGKYVIVSNYNGGNLAVFPVLADGKLGDATAFVQHHGSSVNKARQAGPHVHEAIFSPDNRFVLSTDLGLDDIFVYPFEEKTGKLGSQPRVLNLDGGFGPRHMAFSVDGKFVYLISEMGSTVTVLAFNPTDGNLAARQTVRLAPVSDTPAQKSGAEVAVGRSGKFLYASNRFDNLIGVYSIDNDTGMIERTETVPLDGKTPRDFAIDPGGTWLWDANQDSDNVVLYKIDQQRGGLLPAGIALKIPAPTCVAFVPIS